MRAIAAIEPAPRRRCRSGDAVAIDTTELSIEGVIDEVMRLVAASARAG